MRVDKLLIVVGLICCFSTPAVAQHYPSRPVQIIIPFSAGSATDTVARAVGTALSKHWLQAVNGKNIPGKGGIVAAAEVAQAEADGYTLFIHGAFTINPSIHSDLSYNPSKDFTHIAPLVRQPLALLVSPSSPIKTVSSLIAYAKDESRELTFGSPGTGSSAHLAAEKFCLDANIKVKHVPFTGGPETIKAINNGEIIFCFLPVAFAKKNLDNNKVRVLAVTSRQRASILPDVPSIAETGLSDFEFNHWWGMWSPSGLPAPVLRELETGIQSVLATPDLQQLFNKIGAKPMSMNSSEFTKFVASEMNSMERLAKEAGIITE